jgi:hypothetical protein
LETYRARKPDGGNKKNRVRKENRKGTYLEQCEGEIPGGGPDEGHEARPEPRVDWVHRPTSGGNKNKRKKKREIEDRDVTSTAVIEIAMENWQSPIVV